VSRAFGPSTPPGVFGHAVFTLDGYAITGQGFDVLNGALVRISGMRRRG